jgi:hypothetical protein
MFMSMFVSLSMSMFIFVFIFIFMDNGNDTGTERDKNRDTDTGMDRDADRIGTGKRTEHRPFEWEKRMQIYHKLAGITDPFKPISAGIRPLANCTAVCQILLTKFLLGLVPFKINFHRV